MVRKNFGCRGVENSYVVAAEGRQGHLGTQEVSVKAASAPARSVQA